MKPRHCIPAVILPAAIASLLATQPAGATTYYFDVNGATAGSGVVNSSYNLIGDANWSLDPTGGSATQSIPESSLAYGSPTADPNTDLVFTAGADASGKSYTVNWNYTGGAEFLRNLTVNSGNLTFNTQGENWVDRGGVITTNDGTSMNIVGTTFNNAAINAEGNTIDFNTQGSSTIGIAGVTNGGKIQKDGAGTLTLTGRSGANIDTNNTITINQGIVAFNAGNGASQQISGGTISGTGTLQIGAAGTTGNTLKLGANNSSQHISMTGGWIDVQSGTLRNEYYAGDWTNNKASLNVAAGATVDLWDSPGGITVDALTGGGTVTHTLHGGTENFTIGVNNGSGTFTGTITDDGHVLNLVKDGSGTQVLSGTNSYTGTTTINGGTLEIGIQNGLPSSSAIAVASGATLKMNAASNNTLDINATLTLNGGTLSAGAGATATNYGNYYLDAGGSIAVGANTGTSYIASVSLNGRDIYNDNGGFSKITVNDNSTLVVTDFINGVSGVSWGGISKYGNGKLNLTRGGFYGSGLYLAAGTLEFANGSLSPVNAAGPHKTTNYTVDFEGNATLQWASGNTQDISGNQGNGGSNATGLKIADGVTATFDTNGNNVTLGTAFALGGSNTGALTKTGAGTLTLSAANTYTGATTVNAGKLALESASQASPITVNSGAYLAFALGTPATSSSTVTFVGATPMVTVTGTPVAATLMTASSITGIPVLDPAIPGYTLAIGDGGTTLKLVAIAVPDYTTWANSFLPNNDVSNPAGDNDHDGLTNFAEYAFGLSPISGSSANPISSPLDKSTGRFSYTRRNPALSTGVSYRYEYSIDLGSWATLTPDATSSDSGSPTETVTVTVPSGLLTNTTLFVRVIAEH